MNLQLRHLTTMEQIDLKIEEFKNHPDARIHTILIDWNELHDVTMAFTTHTMKEWPHEFVKCRDNLFQYHGVYLEYKE